MPRFSLLYVWASFLAVYGCVQHAVHTKRVLSPYLRSTWSWGSNRSDAKPNTSKKIDSIFCHRHFYYYIERKMVFLRFFTSTCVSCALWSMLYFASVFYLCFWPLNCLLANQRWNNEEVHPFEQSSYRVHHACTHFTLSYQSMWLATFALSYTFSALCVAGTTCLSLPESIEWFIED